MTQPGSVSQVTVKAGIVTSLGTIVAGTLIANTSTASAIYVSQSTSVSATNGLRVGPLGSVSWTDSTPCYIAVDGQLDVTVTLSTVSANLSSPLDVADAIHKDGVSISGPVTIDGTVPIDGTVTISAPVTIDGTVPITGTVNANISGPVTVETAAGTPLDVNATGTVSLTGPVTVESGSTPLDVTGSTVNVNPVTIDGTVDVAGNVALTGPVAISGTVPISGDVGVSGPVTVSGTVDATIPGNVTVVTPTGTPLDVSVPGTVAVSAIGSTVNIATPSPIDVVASGTVNVNPVTIEGTVPVTGTVELGSGTTVSINGGVEVTGPVTVDGNISVTNTVSTISDTVQLFTHTFTETNETFTVDTGSYESIKLVIVPNGPANNDYMYFSLFAPFQVGFYQLTTTNSMGPVDAIIPNVITSIQIASGINSSTATYTVTVYGLGRIITSLTSTTMITGSSGVTIKASTPVSILPLDNGASGIVTGFVTLYNESSTSVSVPSFNIVEPNTPSVLASIPASTIAAHAYQSYPISGNVGFVALQLQFSPTFPGSTYLEIHVVLYSP